MIGYSLSKRLKLYFLINELILFEKKKKGDS